MNDCVILIPGFFGFGTFGRKTGERISYFDRVETALVEAKPVLKGKIYVHEPMPTGSLESRARSLFEKILAVIGEQTVLGPDGGVRVHLVGHSTGGVDARLVMNPGFTLDGIDQELRESVTAHVGSVTTLSAPLYGTPIATGLRVPFHLLLDALSLWTILDHADKLRDKTALPRVTLLSALGLMSRSPRVNEPVIRLLGDLDPDTALEIERFRGLILSDSSCMQDLAPKSMAAINAKLVKDPVRMRRYVTIAPKPSLFHVDAMDRRAAYALSYRETALSDFEPRELPTGAPWLIGNMSDALGEAPLANDGVVPSSSQYVKGLPAKMVVADHLDVVGHFDGKENTTVFKSGAHFDADEHRKLWTDIADWFFEAGLGEAATPQPVRAVAT